MSTSPWADDPLMGPILGDLDALDKSLTSATQSVQKKLADLTAVANASPGQVVELQSDTERADYSTYFQ